MANYITKITASNSTYDIMDVEARSLISALSQAMVFVGVTSVTITDGAVSPSTYGGLTGITIPTGKKSTDTVDTGTVVIYSTREFVWDGSKWAEFGTTTQWTPTLTKDEVLGSGTTFSPSFTSTSTNSTGSHTHTFSGITSLTTKKIAATASQGSVSLSTSSVVPSYTIATSKLVTTSITPYTFENVTASFASAGTAVSVAKTGTGVTVGTGAVSSTGSGATIVTGLNAGSFSAGALPGLESNGDSISSFDIPGMAFGDTGSASSEKFVKELTASSNADGVNTYTLTVSNRYMDYNSSAETIDFSAGSLPSATMPTATTSKLVTSSVTPAVDNGTITPYTFTSVTASKGTAGTAVTVATGSMDAGGAGAQLVTGVTGATAISAVTGVTVANPTVTLSTGSAGDTDVVTGYSSDTITTSSDGAHSHNYDKSTSITVGSEDLVDAVTNVTLS